MEPLKPEQKDQILRNRPLAQPSDIDEYERLLAERFTQDPSLTPAPAFPGGDSSTGAPTKAPAPTPFQRRENRLRELHQKLFGAS